MRIQALRRFHIFTAPFTVSLLPSAKAYDDPAERPGFDGVKLELERKAYNCQLLQAGRVRVVLETAASRLLNRRPGRLR